MTKPLVEVLRIMDGEKPPMGYIYEHRDRAKETTKTLYKWDESKYVSLAKIMGIRWEKS